MMCSFKVTQPSTQLRVTERDVKQSSNQLRMHLVIHNRNEHELNLRENEV